MKITFEWNDAKAERNLAKHGFSFEEAREVFADPGAVIFDVTREEDGEARLQGSWPHRWSAYLRSSTLSEAR